MGGVATNGAISIAPSNASSMVLGGGLTTSAVSGLGAGTAGTALGGSFATVPGTIGVAPATMTYGNFPSAASTGASTCRHCGNQFMDDANFCRKCGNSRF